MFRHLKIQYGMTFFTYGCLLPYLPIYLQTLGMDEKQIGYVFSASSLAIVVTPVMLTLLADRIISGRWLVMIGFLLAAISLAAMLAVTSFWPVLVFYTLFFLAFVPMTTLQDGLNFAEQQRRRAAGLPTVRYHRIRVYGTLGFIVPSVILYGLLRAGLPIGATVITTIAACLIGAVNAWGLPGRISGGVSGGGGERLVEELPPSAPLPTFEAMRVMLRPHVLVFCLAMFLLHMSVSVYYAFYPLYLTQRLGIDRAWIGLIMAGGVVFEIGYMLGFGRLVGRLGLKRLVVLGMFTQVLRMALLAWWVSVPAALGVQLLHGMVVLVVHVAPAIYLNHHASDRFRHSMQGLFTMLVVGLGRIVGNALAGQVAAVSLEAAFGYAGGLALLGAVLVWIAFHNVNVDEH